MITRQHGTSLTGFAALENGNFQGRRSACLGAQPLGDGPFTQEIQRPFHLIILALGPISGRLIGRGMHAATCLSRFVLQRPRQIGFAEAQGFQLAEINAHGGNFHVRLDAHALDGAPGRRVITRRCQAQRAIAPAL